MTTDVTELALSGQNTPMLSGAGLLGLVTTGMYDNPMSMYREYIQNAADAIAGSGLPGRARVDIAIDVTEHRIRIRDNGPGLSREKALERLLPIGRSVKTLGFDRGFRGVGRLAGLAFAKTVSFTTRAREDQTVTRITWHSDRLPELTFTESDLEEAILDCIEVESLPGSEYPEHFFEVEVGGVARHSAGLLLNRDTVHDYVGEVCPVPISSEFPFADGVERLFYGAEAPLTMEVLLEGAPDPIERPYGESIRLSANREAEFTEFQEVRIPSVDGNGEAALGWIAHSSYLGAIPKEQRVRGMRIRVGNIQIGGETVLDDLFTEERFNRWCVGELHILDPRIIPNARRDYFEPGPHLRNLENHLIPALRGIGARCRTASAARNRTRKVLASLSSIEDTYNLAVSGYLSVDDAKALVRQALHQIPLVRKGALVLNLEEDHVEHLDRLETKLNDFNGEPKNRPFAAMPASQVDIYQKLFQVLTTVFSSPWEAQELMTAILLQTSDGETSGARGE